MIKRIAGVIVLFAMSLTSFSGTAEAQKTRRSCFCDVTCTLPNGSTDTSLSKVWSKEYGLPYKKSQLEDCKKKCADRISNSEVQNLANSKGECGTTVCTATWKVGLGKGHRTGSAGTNSATHSGEECVSDEGCCLPVTSELINDAFQIKLSGSAGTPYPWTYVGNQELNAVIVASLNLERALNPNVTNIWVKFCLYENGVERDCGEVWYHFNGFHLPDPDGFFDWPLQSGNSYEIRASHGFYESQGEYFDKDCDWPIVKHTHITEFSKPVVFSDDKGNAIPFTMNLNREPLKLDEDLMRDIPKNILDMMKGAPIHKIKWTDWINIDRPGGNGDYQTLSMVKDRNLACEKPTAIECRRSSDKVPSSETGEVVRCSIDEGHACVNKQQKDGRCDDYEVRFSCPID